MPADRPTDAAGESHSGPPAGAPDGKWHNLPHPRGGRLDIAHARAWTHIAQKHVPSRFEPWQEWLGQELKDALEDCVWNQRPVEPAVARRAGAVVEPMVRSAWRGRWR